VSLEATPYYHVMTRCVRRAYLCGIDTITGKNFSHRRDVCEARLTFLQSIFAVDIAAYAIMSNHYHLVVYIDEQSAMSWDKDAVIERWCQLFSGPEHIQRYRKGEQLTAVEQKAVDTSVDEWRIRLKSLSWFVRCLNEYMARFANQEDKCTGRFWEGRFKSQALLDEQAILSCMAYVDLNPIRAQTAKTPEQSAYTSIKKRIERARASTQPSDETKQPDDLMPFVGSENVNGPKGIHFDLAEYLNLVDWSGRQINTSKRGVIDNKLPPILERLGIRAENWIILTQHFESRFKVFVGVKSTLEKIKKVVKALRVPGMGFSKSVFC